MTSRTELARAAFEHEHDIRLDVDVEAHLVWLETGEGDGWTPQKVKNEAVARE